jgi:hypothetical protein
MLQDRNERVPCHTKARLHLGRLPAGRRPCYIPFCVSSCLQFVGDKAADYDAAKGDTTKHPAAELPECSRPASFTQQAHHSTGSRDSAPISTRGGLGGPKLGPNTHTQTHAARLSPCRAAKSRGPLAQLWDRRQGDGCEIAGTVSNVLIKARCHVGLRQAGGGGGVVSHVTSS